MKLFNKAGAVKKVHDAAWGHLIYDHGVTPVEMESLRCVERLASLKPGKQEVIFMRVFDLAKAAEKGFEVTSWQSLDEKPGLILFEGYLTKLPDNTALLNRTGAKTSG